MVRQGNKERGEKTMGITRRDFVRLSAVGATGSILAACAPAAPEVIQVEKEVAVEKEVVRTVVVEKEVVVEKPAKAPEGGMFRCQEQVDIFEQTPESEYIDVKLRNVGQGYQEKLLTGLAGGAGPDIYRVCPPVLEYWIDEQLEKLDPWFEQESDSWFWTEDPRKDVIDVCRIAGDLWFMPMVDGMDCALVINKTLFEEAGVEPPTWKYGSDEYLEKWTYPQYLEAAQKLTKFVGGKPDQFGTTAYPTYWLRAITTSKKNFWMTEDGGDFIGDDPDLIDAIQWFADVRLEHEAAPTASQLEGGAFDYPIGKLAMNWAGAYWLCYGEDRIGDRFDWDVGAPPYWPGAEEKNPGGAFHDFCFWCLNPNSKVKEAAWKFFHFLTGPEGMRVPAELAWGFPLFHSLDPPVYGKRIPPGKNDTLALDLYESIPGTKGDFYPWFTQPNFGECWEEVMSPAMDEVFMGLKTTEEAITEIAPKMDDLLAAGKKQMTEWGLA